MGKSKAPGRKETELYEPIRRYLTERGYEAEGEVRGCDIVARLGEELVIIELKRSFSVALLAQAVERQEYGDSVYVALPVESATAYPANFRNLRRLLRRLELGLILVRFLKRGEPRVEIAFHPRPYRRTRGHKKRAAVIREVEGRLVDSAVGGSASKNADHLTAYKQAAIHLALLLREGGPASPATLRKLGGAERAQAILNANHYGWFDRVSHGVYALNGHGIDALTALAPRIAEIEAQVRAVMPAAAPPAPPPATPSQT